LIEKDKTKKIEASTEFDENLNKKKTQK